VSSAARAGCRPLRQLRAEAALDDVPRLRGVRILPDHTDAVGRERGRHHPGRHRQRRRGTRVPTLARSAVAAARGHRNRSRQHCGGETSTHTHRPRTTTDKRCHGAPSGSQRDHQLDDVLRVAAATRPVKRDRVLSPRGGRLGSFPRWVLGGRRAGATGAGALNAHAAGRARCRGLCRAAARCGRSYRDRRSHCFGA